MGESRTKRKVWGWRAGLYTFFGVCVLLVGLAGVSGLGTAVYVYHQVEPTLPPYEHLEGYEPPVMTRIHAGDGVLLADYAREHRLFISIDDVPPLVIKAFLAAEDKNFYTHPGFDLGGIIRAVGVSVYNILRGRRPVGASTITQQVAKNFLLSNELSLKRKFKELILARRLEHTFSKDQILELYLNEIFMGQRNYGVASAALNYFGRPLAQLDIAEAAYLAALPKAPNNYHPVRHRGRALARRNWVIDRMLENGYITSQQAQEAQNKPLTASIRSDKVRFTGASFFTEEVRRELEKRYGEEELYEGGLSVRTTLSVPLQKMARQALREGIVAYDQRHGWRGAVQRLDLNRKDWLTTFTNMKTPWDLEMWQLAIVRHVATTQAEILLQPPTDQIHEDQLSSGVIYLEDTSWARRAPDIETGKQTAPPLSLIEVLSPGDVVYVEAVNPNATPPHYALRQIPRINGAIVVLDPHTGHVLALSGGFSYALSQFNRATQAHRQMGSTIKPFVYAAMLEYGLTPSNIVIDAPFVSKHGIAGEAWKPKNYGLKYYGPSTLRMGLEKSRNLMTVRLVQQVGVSKTIRYIQDHFQLMKGLPPNFSVVLGSGEETLMRLTSAYASFVNGGKKIDPLLITRVQDRYGHTVHRSDTRPCRDCNAALWQGQTEPVLLDLRETILSSQTAYQIVSILEGAVARGTGRRAQVRGQTIAGKTGTTNEWRDSWFIGFSPNMVVGVFLGFDVSRPLGKGESGGRVASPVFQKFMQQALANKPAMPFRIPEGITFMHTNIRTGQPTTPGEKDAILEAFKVGTEPTEQRVARALPFDDTSLTIESGTGGLY